MDRESNTTHPHHSIKTWRKKNTFCKCLILKNRPSLTTSKEGLGTLDKDLTPKLTIILILLIKGRFFGFHKGFN
jgi:hypothetical protein